MPGAMMRPIPVSFDVMNLEDGDTLVATLPTGSPAEWFEWTEVQLKAAVPAGVKVVLCTDNVQMRVLRRAVLEDDQ